MTISKRQENLMRYLTICVLFVALISFLLPYMSVDFLLSITYSGVELIEMLIEEGKMPGVLIVLCPVASLLSLLCVCLPKKTKKLPIILIASSAVGMIAMIIAMSTEGDLIGEYIGYADIGFYLYEMMSFVAIAFTAAGVSISKSTVSSPSAVEYTGMPKGTGIISTKKKCPSCGVNIAEDAIFCPGCGKKIGEYEAKVAYKAEKSMMNCPKCAKSIEKESEYCPFCGAATTATVTGTATASRVKSKSFSIPTDLD